MYLLFSTFLVYTVFSVHFMPAYGLDPGSYAVT